MQERRKSQRKNGNHEEYRSAVMQQRKNCKHKIIGKERRHDDKVSACGNGNNRKRKNDKHKKSKCSIAAKRELQAQHDQQCAEKEREMIKIL